MKKILILAMFLFLTSCATCPKQEIILFVTTPFGPMAVKIKKGTFNEKYHGQDWITLEEWNKLYKEPEPEEKKLPECS